jgi:uncharacterized protein (DUF2141 family)
VEILNIRNSTGAVAYGRLDASRPGIPTEGYGFSNDARAVLSAASFGAASFPYDGRNLALTISLNY